MKKYSSYFNKRYFPEPDESGEEDDSLPVEALSDSEEFEEDILSSPDTDSDIVFGSESSPMSSVEDVVAVPSMPEPPASSYTSLATEFVTPAVTIANTPMAAIDPEVTIISKSAIINGELTVSGDMRMYGKIKGNLNAQGNIEIAGKVIGNVAGNDIELNRCELKGDVAATGFVFMDKESIMIGNVSSQDITLDGKVKGDVAALNKVYVRSNAVIVGNIRATTIAIDEGAALQGQVIIATKESTTLNINEDSVGSK